MGKSASGIDKALLVGESIDSLRALRDFPSNPAALSDVLAPDWDYLKWGIPVHEWRAYVPGELRAVWESMSAEARLAAYLVAEYSANQESW